MNVLRYFGKNMVILSGKKYIKGRWRAYISSIWTRFSYCLQATLNLEMIGMYLVQLIFFLSLHFGYTVVYKNSNRLVLNNMCMLLWRASSS